MIDEGMIDQPQWRDSLNGESASFDTIYRDYHSRIHRYVTRLIGFDEAEDVTQEIFVKISRSLGDFRGDSSVRTWIYRIATNAAMDRVRSAAYRSRLSSDSLDQSCEAGASHALAQPASAEDDAMRKQMSGCVQGFMAQLPDTYRTVLVLSETEGLKNREIADILDASLESVKIRLHRARARLKAVLEANCSFYHDPCNTLLCDIKPAADRRPD